MIEIGTVRNLRVRRSVVSVYLLVGDCVAWELARS